MLEMAMFIVNFMYRILSFCVLMSRMDDAYVKLKVYCCLLKNNGQRPIF